MKKFTTILQAIDPRDGELKTWQGQIIQAKTIVEAKRFCQKNGLGYLRVIGEFIEEIK
jgi:hypothetical protein